MSSINLDWRIEMVYGKRDSRFMSLVFFFEPVMAETSQF
jgi:hypothetical protein